MRIPLLRLLGFLLLGLVVASPGAQCAVIIVTNTQDSGSGSLRDTIAGAAAGDEIKFNIPTSDPGYDPLSGVFTVTLTSGEIGIQNDLTITNAAGARIEISGNHVSRIFHIAAGIIVTVSDLSFINGKALGHIGGPTVGLGGAVFNEGSFVCTRCTFRDNSAVGSDSGHGCYAGLPAGNGTGGAIANQGTLALVACTLVDNSATGGNATLDCGPGFNHLLKGGNGVGGAVCNLGSTSELSLTNCTLTGNTTTSGHGLGLGGGIGIERRAYARGGSVANFSGLTMIHCTVANNMTVGVDNWSDSSAGGLFCAVDSTTELGDTILAGNIATVADPNGTATGPDVAGAVSSQGHNLLGRSDGCTGFTGDDLLGGTTPETSLDPMLGPLSYQGGPTQTLPLLPGSPAINAGDPDDISRDQRYFERTGLRDIGAFEYQGTQPTLLVNISTRLRVRPGDNAMIGGFIITGTVPKTVIVRGIGPSLPLAGALADPLIEVHGSSGELLALNDDWRSALTSQDIIGSALSPTNDLESALWGVINPGAYSVVVRGKNDSTGIGLFEVYDLDQRAESKLGNVSTRGFVETGDNVMIGGTIIVGSFPRALFRAIGPSLAGFGVPGALENPTMELYDGNGQVIATNDNWRDDQEDEIIATGIPPSNDLESAIVSDLAPGPYTAVVRGKNNTTGVALIEVYNLN